MAHIQLSQINRQEEKMKKIGMVLLALVIVFSLSVEPS